MFSESSETLGVTESLRDLVEGDATYDGVSEREGIASSVGRLEDCC